jgi:hypothetical protein
MAGRDIDYNYEDAPRRGDWVYGVALLIICLIVGALLFFSGH